MRALKWSLIALVLVLCSVGVAAWAQTPPSVWHPYQGGINCIQVADANGNFNCYPGITINPVTGVVGGLAGGGTVGSVAAGAGLTATPVNPIVGTGTIAMPNVGPGAGTTCGDTTHSCTVTIDIQGRVSGLSNNVIAGGGGSTPGGVNGNIQINSSGSFGAFAGATCPGGQFASAIGVSGALTCSVPAGGGNVNAAGTLTSGLPVIGQGTTAVAVGTRSGNTTQYVTTTGTQTSGNCVSIDASGNHIASGSACGAGGGNTTSTSLTTNLLPKSNGANSIVNSLFGDDATTGTYTGTGGLVAPSFNTNGLTSGSLTLTNVGGAGFSTVVQVGNPAATYTFIPPITPPTGTQCRTATASGATITEAYGACSGSGGDFSSNTSTSVDSEVVLFSGTAGKTGKRATGSGLALLTSGVLSTVTAPAGAVVGTSDTQTLTNKSIAATQLTGTLQAAQEPAHTGDVTNSAGSLAMTLASVGPGVTSCGDTTHSCSITTDVKGRVTAITNNVIAGGGGSTDVQEYIAGLELTWVSGSAINILKGSAWIEGSAAIVRAGSTISVTGLALGNNVWGYCYLITTTTAECNTTAPAAPYAGWARSKTSDTSRRFLGAIRTDGSGNIRRFHHNVKTGMFHYLAQDLTSVPFRALAAGTATTAATVSLAAVVPPQSREVWVRATNAGATGNIYVASNDYVVSATAFEVTTGGTGSGLGSVNQSWLSTDTSQVINYLVDGAASAYIDVYGYLLDR